MSSFNLHDLMQSFVLGGIASIARKLIEIFRQTLLGFLYVVGPIALTMSVLPGFGKLLLKWFSHYLSVQFWSVTLVILDNLVVLYTDLSKMRTSVMSGLSLSEASEKIDILLLNIVITVLYFMVPYLTSLFIGQSSTGMFQSRALGLATAGAMLLTRGSTAAAGKIIGSQVSQAQSAHASGGANSGQSIPVRRV
jgi:signal transduction histidine kinase